MSASASDYKVLYVELPIRSLQNKEVERQKFLQVPRIPPTNKICQAKRQLTSLIVLHNPIEPTKPKVR